MPQILPLQQLASLQLNFDPQLFLPQTRSPAQWKSDEQLPLPIPQGKSAVQQCCMSSFAPPLQGTVVNNCNNYVINTFLSIIIESKRERPWRDKLINYLPLMQLDSSLPSAQSKLLSHLKTPWTHCPLSHLKEESPHSRLLQNSFFSSDPVEQCCIPSHNK